MHVSTKIGLAALLLLGAPALAQDKASEDLLKLYEMPVAPANPSDPAASATTVTAPDLSHIPFTLPKNIKWRDGHNKGEHETILFGDPDKPGPYGALTKWDPGYNSTPHFHNGDRWIYVVAGTWWVSSSTHYDRGKMYPFPAGTFATDLANTVHWDGAKEGSGPTIILIVGTGPLKTTRYVPQSEGSMDYVAPQK